MARSVGRARARREYLEAIAELDEADRRLRVQLTRSRRLRALARQHLIDGGTAAGLRDVVNVRRARQEIDAALDDLLGGRRRAQKAMYRLAASEGMTAAEIARSWGVSRQLVSRIINHTDRRGQ